MDRRGVEKLESIIDQCAIWSSRITPKIVTLFGGEPLLHPRIHDIILAVRKAWPDVKIRLITNGYLLKKHQPSIWFKYSPMEIQVSIHRKDHEHILNKEIKRILKCRDDWQIRRDSGSGHKDVEFTAPGFRIWKSLFGEFVKPYKDDFTPFNSDPKVAHSICGAPNTPVLYKGKLYKCPPLANALDLKPGYVDYTGFGHNDDLTDFVANIGVPESVCSMCPESRSHSIDHFAKENVIVKHID